MWKVQQRGLPSPRYPAGRIIRSVECDTLQRAKVVYEDWLLLGLYGLFIVG